MQLLFLPSVLKTKSTDYKSKVCELLMGAVDNKT